MSKSTEKLNLPRDISVFEYVSGTQSSAARKQFEQALKDNPELQAEVMQEQQLRALIEPTQPQADVQTDNINQLFEMIDAEESTVDTSSNKTSAVIAIAASLFLAIFLTVNLNNNSVEESGLLEPNFNVLTAQSPQSVDINKLASAQRLIKFTLSSPITNNELNELMAKHQLERLSQSFNESIIIAKTSTSIDETKLFELKKDLRIKDVELVKFN